MIDFPAMMGCSPNPYMALDPEFRFLWANDAYLRATMRSWDEIEGEMLFEAFPPPDPATKEVLRESIRRAFDTGEPDELAFIEYAIRNPDGSVDNHYWSATHTPFRDEAGKVAYVLQHTVDITELETLRRERDAMGVVGRARAVEQRYHDVAREVAELRSLIEQAPGFMAVLTGPDHRYLFANAAYRRLLGQREFIGRTVAAAVPEVAEQGFVAVLDQVFTTGEPYFGQREKVVFLDDGASEPRETFLEFIFQPIRGKKREVTGIFIQGHDVTEEVEAEERQRLLINELNHRVKNTLAVVQGLAHQSFGADVDGRFAVFSARLMALASAHNLLTAATWESADLHGLVRGSLEATAGDAAHRCALDGPIVTLPPSLAVALAMIVHELSTNAIKYGALSNAEGGVTVTWNSERSGDGCVLALDWIESGGPQVAPPQQLGFGTRLIRRGLAGQGHAELEFRPEGLQCRIEANW
jgi:PAS domain S-box-containing protein